MDQGGISLLSRRAATAEDPQTLRMIAGAIANLCGNGELFFSLQCEYFPVSRPAFVQNFISSTYLGGKQIC